MQTAREEARPAREEAQRVQEKAQTLQEKAKTDKWDAEEKAREEKRKELDRRQVEVRDKVEGCCDEEVELLARSYKPKWNHSKRSARNDLCDPP